MKVRKALYKIIYLMGFETGLSLNVKISSHPKNLTCFAIYRAKSIL